MGFAVFIALGSMVSVVPWTLMPAGHLFRGLLFACFAGNLVPYRWLGERLGMERLEWFLFNLIGAGPLLLSALLWANYLFHGPAVTTDHAVRRVESSATVWTYEFRDGYLEGFPLARAVYRDWYPIVGDHVRVTESVGLFGVPIVLRKDPHPSDH
jgi:hypothetical protein